MIASEGGRKADRRVGREEGREIKIKWVREERRH